MVKEEALNGLVHDPAASEQKQASLDEGGEVLDLAVTVLVFCISRLVGNTH